MKFMASSGPRLSAVYTGIDAEVYEKMCIDSDAVSCFIIHSKCSHSGKFDLQIITEACMMKNRSCMTGGNGITHGECSNLSRPPGHR